MKFESSIKEDEFHYYAYAKRGKTLFCFIVKLIPAATADGLAVVYTLIPLTSQVLYLLLSVGKSPVGKHIL
jgi:hypothetical protein